MSEQAIQQRIAAKAVIMDDSGKVLILQESGEYTEGTQEGRWDFPGGRVEAGEPLYDALKREVVEECGLEVTIGKPFFVGEWMPTIRGVKTQIVAVFFICDLASGDIVLSEDHDSFAWVSENDYTKYDLVSPNTDVLKEYFNH